MIACGIFARGLAGAEAAEVPEKAAGGTVDYRADKVVGSDSGSYYTFAFSIAYYKSRIEKTGIDRTNEI